MAGADALSVQVVHKVAQLGSRCVGNCPGRVAEGGDEQAESPQVAPPGDVFAGTRERSAGRGRPTWSRSPHPGVRQPPATAVQSAGVLVESQHAVPEESRTGVPVLPAWSGRSCRARRARRRSPGRPEPAHQAAGADPRRPGGRAGQCGSWPAAPRYGWNRAQARTYGSHVYRSACMPRTAFTGRDLTRIVGRVEVEGPVGTSPDELGAGLPYG